MQWRACTWGTSYIASYCISGIVGGLKIWQFAQIANTIGGIQIGEL